MYLYGRGIIERLMTNIENQLRDNKVILREVRVVLAGFSHSKFE